MVSLERLRAIFPECRDMSDDELMRAYHAKIYGEMKYEDFQRQYAVENDARAARPARGGMSGKKAGGVDPLVKVMDRMGYGRDKESGNFYKYMVDMEGNRKLDYSQLASEEFEAAARAKMEQSVSGVQQGGGRPDSLGLRQQSARQPAQQAVAGVQAAMEPQGMPAEVNNAGVAGMQFPEFMAPQYSANGAMLNEARQASSANRLKAVERNAELDAQIRGFDPAQYGEGVLTPVMNLPVDPDDSRLGGNSPFSPAYREQMAQERQRQPEKDWLNNWGAENYQAPDFVMPRK